MEKLVLTLPLQMLLAVAGFLFHLLKQWYEKVQRKEQFDVKLTIIYVCMNLIAVPTLVFIGGTLPNDLIVMSPFTCVIMGYFGSSMLAGFINVKKPKDITDN